MAAHILLRQKIILAYEKRNREQMQKNDEQPRREAFRRRPKND